MKAIELKLQETKEVYSGHNRCLGRKRYSVGVREATKG